jgi:hypothetical protein
MSGKSQDRALRMEMLRMRAAVERGEVAASLRELRGSTGKLRNLASVAGSLSAAVSGGRSGWMGLLASSVTGRPWLAALALTAVRALKRRPLLAAVVISAVAIGMGVGKKTVSRKSADSQAPDA